MARRSCTSAPSMTTCGRSFHGRTPTRPQRARGRMQYPVNEIFETIQGEAAWTGTPSVFVRLQGCPVGCGWCDTKHTWALDNAVVMSQTVILDKDEAPDHRWAMFSTSDLRERVNQSRIGHVVITGGEPCLYDLTELCLGLLEDGVTVQVETSCTHVISVGSDDVWITGSPKIGMSGGFKVIRESIERADEIKFPIGKDSDVQLLRDHGMPFK